MTTTIDTLVQMMKELEECGRYTIRESVEARLQNNLKEYLRALEEIANSTNERNISKVSKEFSKYDDKPKA